MFIIPRIGAVAAFSIESPIATPLGSIFANLLNGKTASASEPSPIIACVGPVTTPPLANCGSSVASPNDVLTSGISTPGIKFMRFIIPSRGESITSSNMFFAESNIVITPLSIPLKPSAIMPKSRVNIPVRILASPPRVDCM